MNPLLLLHICSAIVGLLSGFMAMALPKGSGLHGAAGSVFFVSMLGMGGAGAYIAAFIKPNNGNVMGGCLAIYLVSTAWMAARRKASMLFDSILPATSIACGPSGPSTRHLLPQTEKEKVRQL